MERTHPHSFKKVRFVGIENISPTNTVHKSIFHHLSKKKASQMIIQLPDEKILFAKDLENLEALKHEATKLILTDKEKAIDLFCKLFLGNEFLYQKYCDFIKQIAFYPLNDRLRSIIQKNVAVLYQESTYDHTSVKQLIQLMKNFTNCPHALFFWETMDKKFPIRRAHY